MSEAARAFARQWRESEELPLSEEELAAACDTFAVAREAPVAAERNALQALVWKMRTCLESIVNETLGNPNDKYVSVPIDYVLEADELSRSPAANVSGPAAREAAVWEEAAMVAESFATDPSSRDVATQIAEAIRQRGWACSPSA